MSDLLGNPEDLFSCANAQIIMFQLPTQRVEDVVVATVTIQYFISNLNY